ncbi:MAG: phage major capsid protein [Gammaproteobacteria bacterium]|nr:phage major capsid protein [Gammaproteobacteria bacterium]
MNFDAWFRDFPNLYAPYAPVPPSQAQGKVCYRFMELDHSRAQKDQRTIEATLSTEAPVVRQGYREILQHDENAVNLERAIDSSLPLLWSHNQEQQIGLAENVRIYQGRLRARLRFSESPRAEEIWQDVKAGIVRGISIGYHIDEYTEKEDSDTRSLEVVATRWTPFEASCVACPADLSAGVNRAFETGALRDLPEKVRILQLQAELHRRYKNMLGLVPEVLGHEGAQERLHDIQRRIMTAKSVSDANACEQRISDLSVDIWCNQDESAETRTISAYVNTAGNGGGNHAMEEFSICRALALTFEPNTIRTGGPELDIMRQAATRLGKGQGDRHTLPEEVLFRSVSKGGDGGNLIGTAHMSSQFIPALRARLITGRMGATILPGLTSDIQIPRQTGDSTATWLAGDGSDQVSPSDPSYDKIVMRPTSVGVSSTISRKMLLQGDPASETLVRDSLAFAVAKAIDTAAINGTGSSNQPLGILGQTGVGSLTYANGGSPSFPNIVDLEKELMVDDADMGNLGYVTTGSIAALLKQTEVVATTGQMIWTATDQGEGRMNGYRALTSNLIPAGHVLFGNWSDLVIGMWSGLDFVVDPYTRASYGDVIITVFADCDIAVRHGKSFSELHEAD